MLGTFILTELKIGFLDGANVIEHHMLGTKYFCLGGFVTHCCVDTTKKKHRHKFFELMVWFSAKFVPSAGKRPNSFSQSSI